MQNGETTTLLISTKIPGLTAAMILERALEKLRWEEHFKVPISTVTISSDPNKNSETKIPGVPVIFRGES